MTKYEDVCVQIKKLNVFLSFHTHVVRDFLFMSY